MQTGHNEINKKFGLIYSQNMSTSVFRHRCRIVC